MHLETECVGAGERTFYEHSYQVVVRCCVTSLYHPPARTSRRICVVALVHSRTWNPAGFETRGCRMHAPDGTKTQGSRSVLSVVSTRDQNRTHAANSEHNNSRTSGLKTISSKVVLKPRSAGRSHAGLRSFVRDGYACLPSLLEKVLEVVLGRREADKEAMEQELLGARSLMFAPLHAHANQVRKLPRKVQRTLSRFSLCLLLALLSHHHMSKTIFNVSSILERAWGHVPLVSNMALLCLNSMNSTQESETFTSQATSGAT